MTTLAPSSDRASCGRSFGRARRGEGREPRTELRRVRDADIMCGPSLKSSKATPQKNDKRSVRTRTAKRIFFCPAAAAERDRAALRERSRSTNSTNDQLRTKEPRKVSSEVRGVAGIVGSPQAQAYAADRVRCERYIRGKALVARATNALLSIDIHLKLVGRRRPSCATPSTASSPPSAASSCCWTR
jgi:hypothetical protein